MKFIKSIVVIALAAMAVSCGNRQSSSEKTETVAVSQPTRKFPQAEIPGVYEGQEAADYYVSHFWDKVADTTVAWRSDSAYVAGIEKGEMEQAFSNFVYAVSMYPIDKATELMKGFYAKTSSIRGIAEIAERYLYDPNSPVRNEDLWQPVAAALASDPKTDAGMKVIYDYQAQMCNLNKVGTKAADIRFCDSKGVVRTLYSVKADYTLLFFSNPGCQACKEIIDNLSNSMKVEYLISEGTLAVVNVYIDEDIQAWRDYLSHYPENWHNGFDPDSVIRTDLTYNVRAIPSLYLLSKDKTVLGKDIPESNLFNFIENI